MAQLFPNSTAGFPYLAKDEAVQRFESAERRGLGYADPERRPLPADGQYMQPHPRLGRVLSAYDSAEQTGSQTMSLSSSEGSVSLCVEETVGGQQWGGNETIVERTMLDAGGDPNEYRGVDTAACQISLRRWTGPSGEG